MSNVGDWKRRRFSRSLVELSQTLRSRELAFGEVGRRRANALDATLGSCEEASARTRRNCGGLQRTSQNDHARREPAQSVDWVAVDEGLSVLVLRREPMAGKVRVRDVAGEAKAGVSSDGSDEVSRAVRETGERGSHHGDGGPAMRKMSGLNSGSESRNARFDEGIQSAVTCEEVGDASCEGRTLANASRGGTDQGRFAKYLRSSWQGQADCQSRRMLVLVNQCAVREEDEERGAYQCICG